MIFRKKLGIFFAGLIVIWNLFGVTFFWVVPQWIHKQIESADKIKATFSKPHTNYFNAISFSDVEITSPVRITIPKVTIAFRPWKILTTSHIIFCDLDQPRIEIPSNTENTSIFSSPFGPVWLRARIIINNGDLSTKIGKTNFKISFLNGNIDIGPTGLTGSLRSQINNWGDVSAQVGLKTHHPEGTWAGKITASKIELKALLADINSNLSWKIPEINGDLVLTSTFDGTSIGKTKVDRWSLSVKCDKGTWSFPYSQPSLPLTFNLDLKPDNLNISSFKVGSGVSLFGSVKPPWKNPFLDLVAESNKASLSELLRLIYPEIKWDFINGETTFSSSIKGTLNNLDIDSKYRIEPAYSKIILPTIDGYLKFNKKVFNSSASFSGGSITIHQNSNNSQNDFIVRVNNFSLNQLGKANRWANIDGIFNSDLNLKVRNKTPSLTGNFLIEGLNWGRIRSPQIHKGRIVMNKNGLLIQTENNSLVLRTSINNNMMEINPFEIELGDNASFFARGRIDLPTQNVQLSISGKKIPPDLWPPLVARYPDIQGGLDFSGNVSGVGRQMTTQLDLLFHELKFTKEGGVWNGSTELSGNRDFFNLRKINVDGGYSGFLSWKSNENHAQGTWSFNTQLIDANPELIRDVVKATVPVEGKLNGEIKMDWDGLNAVGTSSITWVSGAWDNFRFDQMFTGIYTDKSGWKLNKFHLIKGGKAVRAEADGKPISKGWNYDAIFQLQQWGNSPLILDGEFRSSGILYRDYSLDGKIWAPVIWIQDNAINGFEARIKSSNGVWNMNGKGADNILFDLTANKSTRELSGSFQGNSLRIDSLVGSFLPQIEKGSLPEGTLNVNGTVSGTMNNPDVELKADVIESKWRNVSFRASSAFHINSSSFSILPSKISFEDGGDLNLEGSINKNRPDIYCLKGNGSQISLQSVLNFINWNLRWEGKTNLSFVIENEKENKSIQLELDGKHEGIGPLKKGGIVKGRIAGNTKELDLSGLKVGSGDGYARFISGSKIFLEKSGAGKMRLIIESRNLNAGLLNIFGNAELTGGWDSKNKSDDKNQRPIDMDLFARSLWINQYYLDGNIAHITLSKGQINFAPIEGSGQQMSGEMNYENYPSIEMRRFSFIDNNIQKVFLEGFVGGDKWDFQLKLNEVDANIVRGVFNTTLLASGPMNIEMTGKGVYSNPDISARINWKRGHLHKIPLDLAECNLTLKNRLLSLDNILIQKKKGYQLKGFLRLDTSENPDSNLQNINLQLEKGDFSILEEILPDITQANGSFDGHLEIRSKNGKLSTQGKFFGRKIQIQSGYTPNLKKGIIDVEINENGLKIIQASATIGAGIAVLKGTVDLMNGELREYNLNLRSITKEGLTLKIPQLAIPPGPVLGRLGYFKKKLTGVSRGEPTLNLELKGPASSPTLSGTINLKNTVFTYPPMKTTFNANDTEPPSKWFASFRNQINWDLDLKAESRTWYQNELVDAGINGSLRIQGKKGNISVDGRIFTEQGSIVYSGNEFKIKNATLEVETSEENISDNNIEKKTYVYLRATAEREVYYSDALSNNNQDTIVMVVDRALIGEIQPRFYSRNNPNLSSERAFQLAMGLPFNGSIEDNLLLPDQRAEERNSSKDETDKLLRIGLVQLLDSSLASPLARALAQHTGLVDFIRVTYQERDPLSDTPPGADITDSNEITQNEFLKYAKGTKVKFGRGLSRRLFADYSFRVDEFQEKLDLRHEVELAYRLRQSFFLRGITELDSERTLGRPPDRRAILENQWRFGLPRKKKKIDQKNPD